MGRIGVSTKAELIELYDSILSSTDFIVDGIFTHFATADEEDSLYFDKQVTQFQDFLSALPKRPRLVHVANTATILVKDSSLQFDAVRFGISMYGLNPSSYVWVESTTFHHPYFTLQHIKAVAIPIGAGEVRLLQKTLYWRFQLVLIERFENQRARCVS